MPDDVGALVLVSRVLFLVRLLSVLPQYWIGNMTIPLYRAGGARETTLRSRTCARAACLEVL